ncbi:MAG: DUF2341 domain-containing protein [Planctomycetota bacterium]
MIVRWGLLGLLAVVIILGYGGVCQNNVNDILTGSSTYIEAPSTLNATAISASQVNLSWVDNSTDEDGFIIERKTGLSGNYQEIISLPANSTVFSDVAVAEITTYYYRVAAHKVDSTSAYSNEVSITTPWTIVALASGSAGGNTPLSVDTNGKIHICYYDMSNYGLKYVTNTSGNWVTATLDNGIGEYASLAVDRNNKVHISYYDRNNGDLKYATNVSGAWVKYTIDTDGTTGFYSSIAVDSNNKAHISYYDNTSSDLKYATNVSGNWVITRVDSAGNTGMFTSLALDVNNKAHICYYDQTNGDLKYATNQSGTWAISTVDSQNDVGLYTDIAVNSNIKVYISYYDITNKDLKYATNVSGAFESITVDSSGDIGKFTGIALDLANNAHISYYDATSQMVKYARKEGSTWAITDVDNAKAEYTSLVIETHKAHIAYLDIYNHQLKYASNSKGNWQVIAPPLNLIAATIAVSQIDLSWQDNSNNEDGFRIERKGPLDADYIQIGSVLTNTNTYADKNLSIATTYSYRVFTWNTGGVSAYSNELTVATLYSQPAKPILNSPINGSANNPINISLIWRPASYTATYQLQIATDADFAGIIQDTVGITTTSTAYSGGYLTTYYWRVRGVNPGGIGNWSDNGYFATIIEIPAQTTLSWPVMSATGVSLTPTLAWDAANRAETYKLQVSPSSTFGGSFIINQANITATSYTTAALNYNTVYYWRVMANNAGGASAWSGIGAFTTVAALPSIPVLAGPVSGTVAQGGVNPWLTWGASNYATSYEIQISANISFNSPLTGTSVVTSTVFAQSLNYSTPYYWRVRAANAAGYGNWSAIWLFTTNIAPPPIPELASPQAGDVDIAINPLLSWTAAPTAVSYQAEISTTSDFTSNNQQLTTSNSYYQLSNLATTTTYYWHVCAVNAGGQGNWSATRSFTTIVALPETPILSAPLDNSTVPELVPVLSWAAVGNVASYNVQISTVSNFASLVYDLTGITSVSAAQSLNQSITYYWRVKGVNIAGPGNWSASYKFTVNVPPPAQPSLFLPLNGALAVSLTPTLAWQAVSGATAYQCQVAADSGFNSIVINQNGLTATSTITAALAYKTTYYWRVKASNIGGGSDWSAARSFTTLLDPPVLAAPSNNPGAAVSTNPTLSWNALTGAISYQLEVSTAGDFSADTQQLITTDSYYQLNGLANGTVYYWRVRGVDAGGSGGWSTTWLFPTIVGPPNLVSPANFAGDIFVPVTFTWAAATGAVSYQLQISTLSDFSTLICDVNGIAGTLSAQSLSNATTYYWRVRCTNNVGTSVWSNAYHFTSIIAAPAQPVLNTPANLAIDQPISTNLSWNAAARASSYQVQIAADSGFNSIVAEQNGITGTNWTPGLVNGTTYYWHAKSVNVGGSSDWSTTNSFTTIIAAPAIAILESPIQGATGVVTNTVLSWYPADRAATYQLQLATTSNFTSPVIDQSGIVVTSCPTTNLIISTLYYWRVRGTNAGGTSSWSEVFEFTTVVVPPPQPTLVSPENSAVDQPTNITMTWNTSAGASSYRIQISTNSSFSNIVRDYSGILNTSYYITLLSNSKTYYWRVYAANGGGASPWSATRSFTTIVEPPAPPTLDSPADGSTGLTITPELKWNPSSTATSYRIRVATDLIFTNIIIDQPGIAVTSHTPTLAYATNYFWQVKASNAGGDGDWSLCRQFCTYIGNPALVSPPNGTITSSASSGLTWAPGDYNSSYRLQFGRDPNFINNMIDQTGITITSYNITGLVNFTTYYWRVQGIGTNIVTPWTTYRSIARTLSDYGGGNWQYFRPITITNSGSTLTNYQILVTIDTASLFSAGKMQASGNDIRFTNSSATQAFDYWIDSITMNTATTRILVKIPSLPNGNTGIIMYYGNPSAASASTLAVFSAAQWNWKWDGPLGGLTSHGGYYHSLTLKSDGTVWAWGRGSEGQIGDNGATQRNIPVQTSILTNVVAIAGGYYQSLALKSDGTVWAWGYNTTGQLGDNSITQRNTPVQTNKALLGDGVVTILSPQSVVYTFTATSIGRTGTIQTFNITQDGTYTIEAWGAKGGDCSGYIGGLGARMRGDFALTNGQQLKILVGQQGTSSSRAGGGGGSFVTLSDNTILLIAGGGSGAGGSESGKPGNTTVTGTDGGASNSRDGKGGTNGGGGGGGSCGSGAGGGGYSGKGGDCRYNNSTDSGGAGGNGTDGGDATGTGSIAVGSGGASFLNGGVGGTSSSDGGFGGGGAAYSWNIGGGGGGGYSGGGGGSYDQSSQRNGGGGGSKNNGSNKSDASGVQPPNVWGNLTNVVAIAAGYQHSLALKSDGTVCAWGYNNYGQLGDNSTTQRLAPVTVTGLTNVIAIAAGQNHSLALKSDGTVWAWGYNNNGQLGDNSITQRTTPVQTSNSTGLTNIVMIAASYNQSLALRSDGTVWAWGVNNYGQLGDNSITQRKIPVQTIGLTDMVAIGANYCHSLALKSDGTVWAWGRGSEGQIGDNGATQRNTPVSSSGFNIGGRYDKTGGLPGTQAKVTDTYFARSCASPEPAVAVSAENQIDVTTNLVATVVSSNQINLSWQDNSLSEESFKIERSTNGVDYSLLTTVGANITSYSDTSALFYTTYYYRVRSYNSGGNGTASNQEVTRTTVPNAPTNLALVPVGGDSISLSWADNAINETGFKIERSLDGSSWAEIAVVSPNTTSYTNSGLKRNTTYYYRVRAYNGIDNSAYSDVLFSATMDMAVVLTETFASTTYRDASASTDWWDASTGLVKLPLNGTYTPSGIAQSIKINFGSTAATVVRLTPTQSTPANTTIAYQATANGGTNWYPVTPNVVYTFPITGTDLRWKATLATTNPAATPFIDTLIIESDAVTVLNVTSLTTSVVSGTQIDLTWQDNTSGEEIFKIERSINDTSNWVQIATVPANTTAWTDYTVTPDTTYYYRVRSYNAVGNDSWSNEESARTVLPADPTNLITNTVGADNISMQWVDNSVGETGFKVWRSVDGVNYTLVASLACNTTSYTNNGLITGNTYTYKVLAYNGIGDSNYSNVVLDTTYFITATGGTITYSGGYKIHTFTSSGTFNVTGGGNVEVLVVAGGGSGGNHNTTNGNGGGGGGGVMSNAAFSVISGTMTVTVGNGGAAIPNSTIGIGNNGANSVFGSLTAIGGGGGGGSGVSPGGPGQNGGSGGGAAQPNGGGGTGGTSTQTGGYGNAGGNDAVSWTGGGGGGAGSAGVAGSSSAPGGNGGTGFACSISGSLQYYAGGGGGGGNTSDRAGDGFDGGGRGCGTTSYYGNTTYTNEINSTTRGSGTPTAIPNTGGGGGAGSYYGSSENWPSGSGAGGSGIVIVRYLYGENLNVATNLIAQVNSGTEIVLTWQDNSPSENGFKIERSPDGSSWGQIDTVPANTMVYTDTGVSAGAPYYYRVRSYNLLLDHPYSDQAIAQTVVPLAPTSLITTTANSASISLQWTDNSIGETGFKIERKTTDTGFSLLTTVPLNVNSYTNSGLANLTSYIYRVYAYNGMGDSDYTNTITHTTFAAPVNLTFNNTSTGRNGTIQTFTVVDPGVYRIEAWGAQGGSITGYNGGLGARMRGDFTLTAGQTIKILVGQQGIGGPNSQGQQSGGGGGGTFVYNQSTSTLLIAAGGGGGANNYPGYASNGIGGTTATSGTAGQGGQAGGSGGAGGTSSNGGASAGFSGDGTYGALSFLNGGTGGLMNTGWGEYNLHGGFGGGGGVGLPAGGGGGYSGGGGGTYNQNGAGGGGGSYNTGANTSNSSGARSGQGMVTIQSISF